MSLRTKIKTSMRGSCSELPNGYLESIDKGFKAVRYFSRPLFCGRGDEEERIARLAEEIKGAEAILIGAGAGLSASAGLTYSGERFERYFFDFAEKFGIKDMYSGGFCAFPDKETYWAWWARHIYYNRYIDPPGPVYKQLLKLVIGKDYFIVTTNVDHLFQKSGFDKDRLFYTQGDYGLFQSINSKLGKTYDNESWVMEAMEAQGFVKDGCGMFQVPRNRKIAMRIPTALLPKCPDDGSDMTVNLRSDDSFVEDDGWRRASAAYADFLRSHEKMHVLCLELGVGGNTPVIIKYPFWQITAANERAIYACINLGEACCPPEIEARSICINADIGKSLDKALRYF